MAPQRRSIDPDLLNAIGHPLRLRILSAASDEISPKRLSESLGDTSVQLVSYHVRILRDAGLLELTDTKQRRGAIEHFYRASNDASKRLAEASAGIANLADSLKGSGRRTKRKAAS